MTKEPTTMERMMDRLLKILDLIETQARSLNHIQGLIDAQATINQGMLVRIAELETLEALKADRDEL